ncbi:DUF2264 domain-containing protein [Anaerobium acetethylicum]|uniref:DUF2264 domain-containing protein n=1 Tax=Anaerobium acetethylicum TaxID=1619234 RepID=A0A1D3TU85_9FIRM|nr:DUF2264 domain-containing protein [Anaerobium acetethylicum]SCP97627.1 hypothetical protein SAMN05421730_101249 [Anaerobium acetethylicum]
MKYIIEKPDYTLSPYTGMIKKHWIGACHFLLEGIFINVKSFESPIVLPGAGDAVSYPRPDSPEWRYHAERFEGLARSFLIAAPLLANEPDAVIAGYPLKEYYRNQILASVTRDTDSYLLNLQEIKETADKNEHAFQHTCECASLAIGLQMCEEAVWEPFTKEEKDRIAAYLREFAEARTGHHNWRLFNMLILAFLQKHGYEIDRGMMRDHASCILSYYAGDGWYRDGHRFDYYSAWAFQVYGPIWNQWYGYENEPYIAGRIEAYSNQLMAHYANLFDENGHSIMWGRSAIYRNAASAPLAANCLLKNSEADRGTARRILSGNLLQFIGKEEVFVNNVPCLGFYGPFEPAVQSYSCAASPFWIANSFVCMMLPDSDELWNAVEKNGEWENWEDGSRSRSITLDGPGMTVTNYRTTGAVELRTAKVFAQEEDPILQAYSRLSFHSAFPWEAYGYTGPEAMQYSLRYNGKNRTEIPNIILYGGEREGVLYRKAYFEFGDSFQNLAGIDLADFAVGNGLVRVDRVRIPDKPYTLYLGHYGLPLDGSAAAVEEREKDGIRAIIVKSDRHQLAIVNYRGFDCLGYEEASGRNPAAACSILPYAESRRDAYYEYRDYVMITALLHKTSMEPWSDEDLFPISRIAFEDREQCGGYGKIVIETRDGQNRTVDFEGLEGRVSI